MSFYTEAEPVRGAVLEAAPGIRRIVAPNPGGFTYWGTNTYLIAEPGGFALGATPGGAPTGWPVSGWVSLRTSA